MWPKPGERTAGRPLIVVSGPSTRSTLTANGLISGGLPPTLRGKHVRFWVKILDFAHFWICCRVYRCDKGLISHFEKFAFFNDLELFKG